MKSKLISILTGAMVLTLPLATTTVALAQTTTSLTQMFPALLGVSLTPEQQTQLEQLSQTTRAEVEKLLNNEQQAQFQTLLAQGKAFRVSLLSINLSNQQQQQIRKILQSKKAQVIQTLTSEQKRQVMRNFTSLSHQGN